MPPFGRYNIVSALSTWGPATGPEQLLVSGDVGHAVPPFVGDVVTT